VREAVETTENLLLRLDADLAAKGIFPPLVPQESRSSGEDQLRDPEELEKMRTLRAELAGMEPEEAARALADQIGATANNAELLSRL
jgi:transcription termination factor Rho